VKGVAGDGTCAISLMPAWTWLAYIFGGVRFVAVTADLIC
jgi:hypothetical protein